MDIFTFLLLLWVIGTFGFFSIWLARFEMTETKIEYSVEKDKFNRGKWERIYIWMTEVVNE